MAGLFRELAMEQLEEQEDLNLPLTIISPMFWLVCLSGCMMAAAAICFCMLGRIPVSVKAEGVCIRQQGGKEKQVVCYVPLKDGKKISEGMHVILNPSTVYWQECGHMEGRVIEVDNYVASKEDAEKMLKNKSLIDYFMDDGPMVQVICSLREDVSSQNGYYWSNAKGKWMELKEGTLFYADIITQYRRPVHMLWQDHR